MLVVRPLRQAQGTGFRSTPYGKVRERSYSSIWNPRSLSLSKGARIRHFEVLELLPSTSSGNGFQLGELVPSTNSGSGTCAGGVARMFHVKLQGREITV